MPIIEGALAIFPALPGLISKDAMNASLLARQFDNPQAYGECRKSSGTISALKIDALEIRPDNSAT